MRRFSTEVDQMSKKVSDDADDVSRNMTSSSPYIRPNDSVYLRLDIIITVQNYAQFSVKGHHSISRGAGVFVADKLFISSS